jgi:hypothetical protein
MQKSKDFIKEYPNGKVSGSLFLVSLEQTYQKH